MCVWCPEVPPPPQPPLPPPVSAAPTGRMRLRPPMHHTQMLLATEALASTPFLILGNKIDMPYAASEGELRSALNLTATTGKDVTSVPRDSGVRPMELFMCSIRNKTGYGEGLKWLTNFV